MCGRLAYVSLFQVDPTHLGIIDRAITCHRTQSAPAATTPVGFINSIQQKPNRVNISSTLNLHTWGLTLIRIHIFLVLYKHQNTISAPVYKGRNPSFLNSDEIKVVQIGRQVQVGYNDQMIR
jgi:hypothetical protein